MHSTDLEWKLIYVGNAESEAYDQVLDSVLVGPVYPGQYRFVFQVHIFPTTASHTLRTHGSIYSKNTTTVLYIVRALERFQHVLLLS